MARPVTITDEQILEAARVVFARDGVNATTKDIACRAKTSEGTLFRRFPTKEALFLAAVLNPPPPAWVLELDELVGKGDLHANLVHVAQGMVHFVQEIIPLVTATWTNRMDQASILAHITEPPAIRDRRRLAHYLRQEMEQGRLRSCNPEAVACLLFGACVNLVMEQRLVPEPPVAEEVRHWIIEIVDTLWESIRPKANGIP